MKICTKCKEEKPKESFNKRSKSVDGLQSVCRACGSERMKLYYKDYYEENKDRKLAGNKLWQAENAERVVAYREAYYAAHKEEMCKKQRAYNKLNPAKRRFHRAKRRATKLNATPSWLTQEHYRQIDEVYWLAKDLEIISGQPYHVDHIIPLQGDNVCGLHVPWNLQVLPSDINMSKSNKHVA